MRDYSLIKLTSALHLSSSQIKIALWNIVKKKLIAKHSTPYSDYGPHDFMHNKLIVVDGRIVKTGSFNFSSNATKNAENILTIYDEKIVAQCVQYIKGLVTKYGQAKRTISEFAA